MLYNLLNQQPILKRDATRRMRNKEAYRATAMQFGREYFDGNRDQGYGGYFYDGRWKPVAARIIERYKLNRADRFLDVGCAKGFLMADMHAQGISVSGIDISEYAIFHSGSMMKRIKRGSCDRLPYDNNHFDCSVAINTIHNLDQESCAIAIQELMRVTRDPRKIFIQVDAYEDRQKFEDWNLTAKTCLRPAEWIAFFGKLDYIGDYFFTILG